MVHNYFLGVHSLAQRVEKLDSSSSRSTRAKSSFGPTAEGASVLFFGPLAPLVDFPSSDVCCSGLNANSIFSLRLSFLRTSSLTSSMLTVDRLPCLFVPP